MNVAVVGAGFAGIRAAERLTRLGFSVTVYEARNRVGGRCETLVRNGQPIAELGGEWIDGDHTRLLDWLAEYGYTPRTARDGDDRYLFRQEWTRDPDTWDDALVDDLRVQAAADEACRNLPAPGRPAHHDPELDRTTVQEFIDFHTDSPRGNWLVTAQFRSDEGEDLSRVGLRGWLENYRNYQTRSGDELSAYRFPEGSQTFLATVAARLRLVIRFQHELVGVRALDSGVELACADGQSFAHDAVIITLPAALIPAVAWEPLLPEADRARWQAMGMARAIKVSWECTRAWWREEGYSGRVLTDTPVQQLWDGSLGDTPILNAYICGDATEDWRDSGDAVSFGWRWIEELFPEAMGTFVSGWFADWPSDPLAGGAFSYLPPEFPGLPSAQHGRVFFAGEALATWPGFIEGAVESADAAVDRIVSQFS